MWVVVSMYVMDVVRGGRNLKDMVTAVVKKKVPPNNGTHCSFVGNPPLRGCLPAKLYKPSVKHLVHALGAAMRMTRAFSHHFLTLWSR